MLRVFSIISLTIFLSLPSLAQEGLVRIEPADANADQQIRVIYDASEGATGLVGADKVYMHSGVITDSPDGTSWQSVVGNWGQDDGIGQMTPVNGEDDVWEITLSPTARDYYGVDEGVNIFRLSMVFRNANGQSEGKGTPGTYSWGTVASNGDIYVDLAVGNFVRITTPQDSELFINAGESVTIAAEASSEVSSMEMAIDEGGGFNVVNSVNSATTISYEYSPLNSVNARVRVTANIGGEEVSTEETFNINVIPATTEAPLPAGMQKGINYTSDNSAVLVLEAPGKDFVYVVGDFNSWQTDNTYLMHRDPDTGYFWHELTGLVPGQKYVFQYWIDGTIRVGDPYADEVADADNDPFIPSSVHPNIAPYNQPYGPASVLQTAQVPFSWSPSEDTWNPPPKEDLIIYELLIRDFLETHSYNDLIDTLSYLKRLGINAIELMPIMEFEGNSSWGYNPSYFFAVDKYYGTKDDFKQFVQAAHQEGIAVIVDMVLNHAFGQSPMVRMYFDNGAPTSENPWFNTTARHPFNVGYDFNHESALTKAFVDSVNNYWLTEYHIDGYRFDLSKGFTQFDSGDDVGLWSAYDASRVALLKRMAGEIWDDHPDAYVILEHFGSNEEETELVAEGMMPWRNVHGEAIASLTGANGNLSAGFSSSFVSYMESHDEERILYEAYGNGSSSGPYSTSDSLILLERHKMSAAFFFMLKGPKMLWQFGELGYDYLLNGPDGNNRLEEKPLPWGPGGLGYYEDPLRQYIYDVYSGVLNIRREYGAEIRNAQYTSVDLTGEDQHMVIDGENIDFVVVGNFGLESLTTTVDFTSTGVWYDYFSGEDVQIDLIETELALQPGEFHIYTSENISDGYADAVETFQVPVTVSPDPFTKNTEITLRFDAAKSNPAGTAGLRGVSRVFMYSGVVKESGSSKNLENIVDDASAELTAVDGETDIWEITLTPSDYYSLSAGDDIFRLGMYFRNEDGTLLGKGFRGSDIFLAVEPDGNAVSIQPEEFSQNDVITITYDARFGSGVLADADKIYMHSGVVLTDKDQPTGTDWTNVVGDWGEDNGIGQMSPVAGENGKWEITLTPADYYDLSGGQQAYWLAMVFRNADGSRQSTLETGDYGPYFVAGNGDIFYAVPDTEQVVSVEDQLRKAIIVYPNPADHAVWLTNTEGIIDRVTITDLQGRRILSIEGTGSDTMDVSLEALRAGLYLIQVDDIRGRQIVKKLIIER